MQVSLVSKRNGIRSYYLLLLSLFKIEKIIAAVTQLQKTPEKNVFEYHSSLNIFQALFSEVLKLSA